MRILLVLGVFVILAVVVQCKKGRSHKISKAKLSSRKYLLRKSHGKMITCKRFCKTKKNGTYMGKCDKRFRKRKNICEMCRANGCGTATYND